MVPVSELIQRFIDRLGAMDLDDPRDVLDERALSAADELRRRRITDVAQAMQTCHAIASLHYFRRLHIQGDQGRDESIRAAALFSAVGRFAPEMVPDEIRDLADDSDNPYAKLDGLYRDAVESRDPAALNLAAAILRRNLESGVAHLEDLATLAEVLWARAERVRDIEDLEEAAAVNGSWLAAASESHPDRAFRLWRSGLAEFGRHVLSGERADLDTAITHYFNAYKRAADDDPKRRSYVSDLCMGLHQRADLTGQVEDYDLAVDAWQLSLVMTPSEHPDHAADQFNLGTMLSGRFEAAGEPGDLDGAIDAWRQAAAHFSPGHRLHTTVLPVLADALQTRAGRNGDHADADEAARLLRSLVRPGETGEEQARILSSLATALWTKHTATEDPEGLERSIEAARTSLALTPRESPRIRIRRSNLSNALIARYQRIGELDDLAEAVELARLSVDSIPPDLPECGVILSNAGNALREHAERTGAPGDLGTAVELLRMAIDAFALSDHRRAAAVANLATTLRYWAERTGDLGRADEAVAVARSALDAAAGGGPHQAGIHANLASALWIRYRFTGSTEDLDEAVEAARTAVRRTPLDQPSRLIRLGALTTALIERSRRFDDADALNEAVDHGREALDGTPASHPDRAIRATYLATAHMDRFRDSDDVSDLETAVSLGRDAVAATPEDHSLRPAVLSNLADYLSRRFDALADVEDLEQATSMAEAAVAATPEDSPHRTAMQWVLAKACASRFELTGDKAFEDRAVAYFAAASEAPTGPVSLRIRAAYMAARTIMGGGDGDASAALPLMRRAVKLLPRLAWRGLERGDQQRLLENDAYVLAMDAAACAIEVGDTDEAVRLLEEGRGVLWGQQLDLRSDRARLREAHPELAAELERCLAVLDPAGGGDEALGAHREEGRNDAALKLDALTAEIRALPASDEFPNPDEFMAPPRPENLVFSGRDALVVLNTSRWRSDAIVLTEDGVTSLRLPFTSNEVVDTANRYLSALRRHSGPTSGMALEAATRTTLEWLWDGIAAPVLDHLGLEPESDASPRIWWCPTGPLNLLPIHAAGNGTDSVLDRAVSSYTPTLRALAHARSQRTAGAPTPLVVSIGQTPGQFADLPGAERERRMLIELFGADAVTALEDESATRDAIVDGLGTHSWVHIASHGIQDLGRPSEGGLVPFDWETAGLVRVDDLASIAGNGGGLAFLSACQTATGGVVNIDEAISVAAAMQHAGWSHVVGTLWTVYDDAASEVAEHFYRHMIRDGRPDFASSAYALREAVMELRAANPRSTAHWARFVHFGP